MSDARRSKARHEIKKTRNVLMKIDQRHIRRTLGREGEELCNEINRILRKLSAEVGRVAKPLNHAIDIMARLDLITAKARFSRDFTVPTGTCRMPAIS